MTAQHPGAGFLSDLSLAYAGERIALQILEQGAGEVVDERARAVLTRHAGETRAQLGRLEQVFSLFGTRPQAMDCPANSAVRQELDRVRRQDPAPQILTTMTLFAQLRMERDAIAAYGSLIDEAVLRGQLEAARILTTVLSREEQAAATYGRLIPELLREMAAAEGVTGPA